MIPSKSSSGDARVEVTPVDAVVCRRCGRHLGSGVRRCPHDGEVATVPADGDSLVGQVIDARYVVKSVLGHGGMGIVYAVQHLKLGRPLALKVLRQDLARDADLCKRFIQEARAAAAVNHPGVVQITDFGVLTSGQPYFVMELLAGRSLSRLMAQERPLRLERMVAIVEQLVDALAAAHAVNVIHRDLKPDNIHVLTDPAGKDAVKVLDFGLARVAGATRLTKQGFVFGTPHYMSPEQAQGDSVDHRADIYALGVLMYEMATGQVPFDAESYMGVLTKHISTTVVPPSKVLGHRRLGALEVIVLRCLEKRAHKRYQSLRELGEDLRVAVRWTEAGIQIAPRSALSVRRWAPERGLRAFSRPWSRGKRFGPRVGWLVPGLVAASLAGIGWWALGDGGRRTPVASAARLESERSSAKVGQHAALGDSGSRAPADPAGREPGAPASAGDSSLKRVSIESARPEAAAVEPAQALLVPRPKRTAAPKRPGPAPVPTTDIVDPWADGAAP
ncbi:MAG TPA: protein kinase [Polyangiaceae bacterium]|nr:protein kinase [Polyangiaceae bacterium]